MTAGQNAPCPTGLSKDKSFSTSASAKAFLSEAELQKACVRWFDDNIKTSQAFLFSVPNGGTRHKLEAISLKKQGLRPGVSDLILLVQDNIIFLELKFKNGKQSEHQMFFEKVVNTLGFNYYIVKSLKEFIMIVSHFL